MDFTGLSLDSLTSMKQDAYAEYKKAKSEKKNDEMLAALAEMKQFDALIEKKNEEKPVAQHSNTDYSSYSQIQSTMRTIDGIVDKIPIFSPGMEVQPFLRQVGTASYLAGSSPLAVNHLIKRLVTRLCPEYCDLYTNHVASTPIDTIEEFKSFFSTEFESKKSVFQIMSSIDTWARKSTETHRDYAGRFRHDMFYPTSLVNSKWKEAKKQENASFDKEMEADDVFKLIGGMVLLRDVAQDRLMFDHVITRIDKATDASGVASVVMGYSDRKQPTDQVLSSVGEVNLAKGQQRDDTSGACRFWLRTGECQKRDTCPWSHLNKFKGTQPDQSQNGQSQSGRNQQDRGGNRNGRSQGGRKYPKKRKPFESKQSFPNQANHVEAEQNFENTPFVDAFAGAGFQN